MMGGATAALASGYRAQGDASPPVIDPRATSGDRVHEPDWAERLTVTVGTKDGDIIGADQRAIQAAVDYVARLGGGTVKILPGTYRLRNAVYLQSHIRILGSGENTILIKEPSVTSLLSANSDWYDQEITLADASGFRVGDGVCLRGKNPHNGSMTVLKRTLIARTGNRFKLDKALRENLWMDQEPKASTLFPLLTGEYIEDVVIENLALDGNKDNNENLDGNYAGGIFIQDCSSFVIRGVTSRNYNGDGMSWQICHDVLVENCRSHDNIGLGLHPGSGSQRPIMRMNIIERNDIGIFFCWGVKFGLAEENTIDESRNCGISIGHNDTDNVVANNQVLRSGNVGILFRDEEQAFAGHRNRIEENTIVDSGGEGAAAIDIQGQTENLVIQRNTLRESRGAANRVGIRIGSKTANVTLAENVVEGFSETVKDLRAQE